MSGEEFSTSVLVQSEDLDLIHNDLQDINFNLVFITIFLFLSVLIGLIKEKGVF